MGIVYRAWQPNLKRYVALKMVLSAEHASQSDLARFKAESEAVAGAQTGPPAPPPVPAWPIRTSEVRGPLMIGFIGAYTTFSTLALESWRLLEDGAYLQGVANLGGSVVLGLAALVAGIGIGRALA